MELASNATEFGKRVNSLKRKIVAAAKEVESITEQARMAHNDPANENFFYGMYTVLDKYFNKFESLWESCVDAYNEANLESDFPKQGELKYYTDVKAFYYQSKSIYEKLTRRQARSTVRDSANTSLFDPSNLSGLESKATKSLPRLQIPTFDGDILKFPKFRDTFTSLVHQERSLTNIDRFHYLLNALTGPAASVISSFGIEDQNYEAAWKAVLDTYDNKRMLATSYLNQVLTFKPLQGKPTIDSLKTFLSTVSESVNAFRLLDIPTPSEYILFHLAIKCLDSTTREQFEIANRGTDFPTFDMLSKFVRERCLAMQLAGGTNPSASITDKPPSSSGNLTGRPKNKTTLLTGSGHRRNQEKPQPAKHVERSSTSAQNMCPACKVSDHHLLACGTYEQASVDRRHEYLRQWKGCRNCLASSHTYPCPSRNHCRFCKSKHHSSLHRFSKDAEPTRPTTFQSSSSSGTASGASYSAISPQEDQVILGTIQAEVLDAQGSYQTVRMVLDSGSQLSFITVKCLNRLGLAMERCPKRVSGIGATFFEGTKGKTLCQVKPRTCDSPQFRVEALVVPNITAFLPNVTISSDIRKRYTSYHLADPTFWKPGPIDFLLGADFFSDVFTGTTVSIDDNLPRLLDTVFGHIVVGRIGPSTPASPLSLFAAHEPDECLNELLTKFWELEEPKPSKRVNPDDVRCEEHFQRTHQRLEDGSYMVRLPFKTDEPSVGNSSAVALRRLQNLERKLQRTPDVRTKYQEFMAEYSSLGHMSPAPSPSPFVIPHHSVVKETPAGKKIRVVFDASVNVKPSSLNGQLLTGAKLQNDIRSILLNFRRHSIVFLTDVVKCYRYIKVHPDDRKYQHIYWRDKPTDAVQEYELNTVTYGLSSSPFAALRVFKQLCQDEGSRYPQAAKALESDIYIDDVATGAETTEEACNLAQQIIGLMGRGGFSLSKWASNSQEILDMVPDSVTKEPIQISDLEGGCIKILGLKWEPASDSFGYAIDLPAEVRHTKRAILSAVSKVYDPLGFLAPTIITMKMFIQSLWKGGYSWDQPIAEPLKNLWHQLMLELPKLTKVSFPRFLETSGTFSFQLVGFADASTSAFCGAIYIRILKEESIQSFLLTSKTKLTSTYASTIPRKELCGAYLLSQLYEFVIPFTDNLPGTQISPVFFTDSSTVLGWLNTPQYRLKTYVANRVGEITAIIEPTSWRHVSTTDNPSDLGTRGLMPDELVKSDFWWHGPGWLCEDERDWPTSTVKFAPELPETKPDVPSTLVSRAHESPLLTWMSRISSFQKITRCVAWLRRWMWNTKHLGCCCCPTRRGPLKLYEVREATIMCVRMVQQHYLLSGFPSTEKALAPYAHLSPFIDSEGVIRVGGRLKHANISASQKHPALLPPKCHFTIVLVDFYHRQYLHPGPTALQALIQMNYWIPSLRRVIQLRGFHCKRCYESKAITIPPKMADLPAYRVNGGRPFVHVGIDFAGPFVMRESLRRKAATSKVYLAVYVCMATKALHLEAVTRLTTDAFIASFERFTSRRGLPTDVYTDRGSNFIGAASEFRELQRWIQDSQDPLIRYSTSIGFDWHFNPPHTPHMGGIWEAGVKSVKKRLHIIARDTPLTYEELSTLFAKIEAQLNSRPLCPLSSSPDETDFLSPGHFLIGGPLVAPPQPSLLDVKENRLDRWQLIQRMTQQFWNRWRREYLSTLQHRQKWKKEAPNLQPGDLVIIKEDNVPPLQWPLGKVEEARPSCDGVVRVVKLRTAGNTCTRSVHRLVPLLPLKSDPYDQDA